MKEGEKDIGVKPAVSKEEEVKQIEKKIEERQTSSESLKKQIKWSKERKESLEKIEQDLYDQIQEASDKIRSLEGSKNFEDVSLVKDLELKIKNLSEERDRFKKEIQNIETQIEEKEKEKEKLEIGRDTSYHILMEEKPLEEQVEEARKKFETAMKELNQLPKILKEKKKELEKKEEELASDKSEYFVAERKGEKEDKIKSREASIWEKEEDIKKTEKEVRELEEKKIKLEEETERLGDHFLDLKNRLEKIRQQ